MLLVHRSERADGLVELLGDLLLEPLPDPMAPEVVSVPTRGVERWLTQTLSGRLGAGASRNDGVCANVDFPFPGRLVGDAVTAALGRQPETDPWSPQSSVWPLLEVIDASLAEPWLATLAAHLGASGSEPDLDALRRGRRFATARHVADLFDRYAVHRPEMLRAWAAGSDADGEGNSLPEPLAWQPALWRRLRDHIGVPSPVERLEAACERMSEEPALLELPERLSIFGLTRLPHSYVEVLRAVAAGRDVHLFLLHPSPALWDRLRTEIPPNGGTGSRRLDPTADAPQNRLLASWGTDSREMQLTLAAAGSDAGDHRPIDDEPRTLLARIQADIRADRRPGSPATAGAEDPRPMLEREDTSLQIHACHGRARQVEVIRDAVLHLLADDPTLEPRDVIVMCPDIETYAPLVHAVFGAGERSERADEHSGRPPDLRVRLADRSLRQTNPVLGVVADLLELASSRLTTSQVLTLASREPVRRRFRLDEKDLELIEDWIAAAGVRWGLDADGRAPFGLEDIESNTWRSGLDRILLGATMADEDARLVNGVLPLDHIEPGRMDLAGRLAELVERVGIVLRTMQDTQPLDSWLKAIAGAADLLTEPRERDRWQRDELERMLDEVRGEATAAGGPPVLSLAEVRALLADRLRGRPTRANFRTGHLTVCTLVPMRSVPHRVVCLLGLDDGAFPRKSARDGDDIVLLDPHVGDRDARTEDLQLLLDAVMAARDHLVITYGGRDERTNEPRPPAVPVGELLDVVDRTVRPAASDGASERASAKVVVEHPLQPFDPRSFAPGALVSGGPWSFDPVQLAGARAISGPRRERPPFLAHPLPAADESAIELDELVRFLQHPVSAFLRQRLGVWLAREDEEVDDALPIELKGLEGWGVGDALLRLRLAGIRQERCLAAERARGSLPPGSLGESPLAEIAGTVEELVEAAEDRLGDGEPRSLAVNVHLPDGRALVGTVSGVRGEVIGSATYSRLGPKHRLAAWVRLLALTAADADRPYEAVTIGRASRQGQTVAVSTLGDIGGDTEHRRRMALALLAELVDLRERGLREPLPLYCATSAAYARAVADGKDDPHRPARKEWTTQPRSFDLEDRDRAHVLVLGDVLAYDDLLAFAPTDAETGSGWERSETTRLGRLARRLWDPLLARERLAGA